MGVLYNVNYPGSAACDINVPWSYLEQLGRDLKNIGAIATETNGGGSRLQLQTVSGLPATRLTSRPSDGLVWRRVSKS